MLVDVSNIRNLLENIISNNSLSDSFADDNLLCDVDLNWSINDNNVWIYSLISLDRKIKNLLSDNSILFSDDFVLELPSIPWSDLVFKVKDTFDLNKNNFSNIKEFVDNIYSLLSVSWIFKEVKLQWIFINIYLNDDLLKDVLIENFNNDYFWNIDYLKWKNICIDYSSCNLAKQMTVWHLRSTVIWQSLSNIFEKLWANVFRWNYLWDWWTPFWKVVYSMIYYYTNNVINDYYWENLFINLSKCPTKTLWWLYSNFSEIPLEDKNEMAKYYFNQLEKWNQLLYNFFIEFRKLSLIDFETIYSRLWNVFDTNLWESFSHKLTDWIISELQEKWYLLFENDAWIVKFKQEKIWNEISYIPLLAEDAKKIQQDDSISVFLIKKSDWSTLYATRDLAVLKYRISELKADKLYYVVWPEQALHFSMLFSLANSLWWINKENMVYITFWLFLVNGSKMSSRSGNFYSLWELLDMAVTKLEWNEKLAMWAVVFNDLKNDRIKDINFDIDTMTKFNWDTWVYVNYTYARLNWLLEKIWEVSVSNKDFDFSLLNADQRDLVLNIMSFPSIIIKSYKHSKSHILAQWIILICHKFNTFYSNSDRILDMSDEQKYVNYIFLKNLEKVFVQIFELLHMSYIKKM